MIFSQVNSGAQLGGENGEPALAFIQEGKKYPVKEKMP